jgi:uncharacterized membrane protein
LSEGWQKSLTRWMEAGLVDAAAAGRIRAFEEARGAGASQGRLALVVFGFGGLLLVAGILLFVAAHWDTLSPGYRFTLVLAMVAVLHAAGAAASARSEALSATLHAAGTGALGAGIFLAGQVFHMAEHWPGALLLWSIGAAVGMYLLRQWPQLLWLAVLAPAWLCGEWIEAQRQSFWSWGDATPMAVGLVLLACAYLMAKGPEHAGSWRRVLAWLGAIALIPAAAVLGAGGDDYRHLSGRDLAEHAGSATQVVGWALAIALPLAVAWFVRGRDAVWMLAALAWALLLSQVSPRTDGGELATYALLGAGAVGVVLWGLRDRQRLAINVGVLGFALAVCGFYFGNLFDKLGRSLGLIGLGILFIGGGWLLERTRRRLIARATGGAA